MTFRIAATIVKLIHEKINNDITKELITEEPISTEQRLAVWLHRLSTGDYHHTLAKMMVIGESTICDIVRKVAKAIVENLWPEVLESNCPCDETCLWVAGVD